MFDSGVEGTKGWTDDMVSPLCLRIYPNVTYLPWGESWRLDVENNTLDDFFVLRQNITKPDQNQCHVRLSISILYTV